MNVIIQEETKWQNFHKRACESFNSFLFVWLKKKRTNLQCFSLFYGPMKWRGEAAEEQNVYCRISVHINFSNKSIISKLLNFTLTTKYTSLYFYSFFQNIIMRNWQIINYYFESAYFLYCIPPLPIIDLDDPTISTFEIVINVTFDNWHKICKNMYLWLRSVIDSNLLTPHYWTLNK